MPDIIKTAANPVDVDVVRSDLDSLRRDLGRLVDRVRYDAKDEMRQIYDRVAAEGGRQTENLARRVEERPLTALLLAFGIGFLGGKFFLR